MIYFRRVVPIFIAFVFMLRFTPMALCETPQELTEGPGYPTSYFGWSVAVSGNTAVIGAWDNSPGAAYVFTLTPAGWTQVAELTASDGLIGDYFGISVAIDHDTIVVGAPHHTATTYQQGAAYVFVEPSGGWSNMTETAELTASNSQQISYLGYSVAISGRTVLAGSPLATVGENAEQGAAYIFVEPRTGWTTTSQFNAELAALDGDPYDRLGWSVALDGDTAVAGAYAKGAAYVFVKSINGWSHTTQTAKLTPSVSGNFDFGLSVSLGGDTVCVGAPGVGVSYGGAYVYVEPNGGWENMTETAQLKPSDRIQGDYFGVSVSISGSKAAVGATYEFATGIPAVYVFDKPIDGWQSETQSAKLTPSGGGQGDYFGQSVFVNDKFMFVGAPAIPQFGAVYVY